jgi:hypothetical protein
MTSLRPAWLEIDIDALAHNVRLHRRAAGPDYRGHDGRPPDGASAMSAGRTRRRFPSLPNDLIEERNP